MNQVYQINDSFTIENFLSKSQCLGLIEWAETTGFDQENRLIFEDEKIAEKIWTEIKIHFKQNFESAAAIGINEIFRLYKISNSHFPPDENQIFVKYKNEIAAYSIMLFLNKIEIQNLVSNAAFSKTNLLAVRKNSLEKHEISASKVLYLLQTEIIFRK